jgi:hypothetical protein
LERGVDRYNTYTLVKVTNGVVTTLFGVYFPFPPPSATEPVGQEESNNGAMRFFRTQISEYTMGTQKSDKPPYFRLSYNHPWSVVTEPMGS